MGKYIDGSGLSHLMGIIKGWAVPKTRTVNGHALSADVTVTASDIGVASGAEVNQNAFSNVKVGSTNVAADSKTDTLELVGSNVTLTPDATNDKVTIGITASNVTTALGNTAVARATADASGNNIASTYANQNAFSTVMVDASTAIEADSKTDTLNLNSDNGISLTANSANDTITIALDSSVVKSVNGNHPSGLTGDVQISASELLAASTEDGETIQDALDFLMGAKFDGVGFSYNTLSSHTLTTAHYALCSTEAATPTKTVSIPGFELVTGAWVAVKFQNANTGAVGSLQLRVDGATTGTAKAIKYRGANLGTAGQLGASRIYLFVYDGTNWEIVGDLDTNTTYSVATTSANGLMSSSDKTKLNGIATGAEVNQNAFSNVKVGSTTVEADAKTDTFELAGSNVTLTPDATNDKVTIGITASNVTTALGNTAVARATGDASGNAIASTYAKLASPTFTGTPSAPTAAAGTNTTQVATTAFVTNAVGTATAGALQYKGVVNAESTITGASYKKGWYYVVGTAGTYVGKTCEVGDMLIAKQDKSSTVANDWDAVQSNIEVLSNSEIDTLWAAA